MSVVLATVSGLHKVAALWSLCPLIPSLDNFVGKLVGVLVGGQLGSLWFALFNLARQRQ